MFQRKIFTEIEKNLNSKEILIFLGARQVGKTSIMKYFFEKISEEKNNIQKIFLNLDKNSDCEIFSSFENVINFLKLKDFNLNEKIFLFVDEFQYCKNSERIFKNIYDEFENIKIIASGSASMDIKNKVQESLAGRKKIFNIYPLDLEEFISWKIILDSDKNKNNFENKKNNLELKNFEKNSSEEYGGKKNILINFKKFSEINGDLEKIAKNYFEYLYEYMIFGGYPQLVLENNLNSKQDVLDNIFDLYLKKDILDFLNIKNISGFKKLVVYLALNNGSQINFSDLANFSDLDINTTKSYLEILQETFIVKQVKPFFTNKNKEIIKAPKIYFLDNGVRNYFIKNFGNEIDLRQDKGELFEGVVLQEFVKNNYEKKFGEIKYWRTKSGVEVDFIIDKIQKVDIYEVKFKNKLKNSDFSGLKNFSENYKNLVDKNFLIGRFRGKNSICVFDLMN